jgi:hypothetical protein
MKKGKTKTMLVLALEIASIIVLHAIKINQSEKPAREVGRTVSSPAQTESRAKSSYYSLATYSLTTSK